MVKNSPASAGGTWSGKIPSPGVEQLKACVLQFLSPSAGAPEPQLLSLRAATAGAQAPRPCAPQHERPPQRGAWARQGRVAPLAAAREKSTQ